VSTSCPLAGLTYLEIISGWLRILPQNRHRVIQLDIQEILDGYPLTLIPSDGKVINNYLPLELLREILLYSIEVDQAKSGQLASVCRYWRSAIISIPGIWSTIRVGNWTQREQVVTWMQRAYPKKVVIDIQADGQRPPKTTSHAALQAVLTSTGQWHNLTVSSFLPEDFADQLDFHVAKPMNMLKALHVAAECVHTAPFTCLLDLVPPEASLSELGLSSAFASAYFLQPQWFPVLQNLTVFIVNGRDVHDTFELLPTFTQLQILEVDHLSLPSYEASANLPLLRTLQRLQVRASSIQWMAGREFPCLVECSILLPHHWRAVQQHRVQLPSCRKLTYHGYPMITIQYFHALQLKAIGLGSPDCNQRRVCWHLHRLCRSHGSISKLTRLHLTLQCSERAFIKVLKYMDPLQDLILSIAYPSFSWEQFLISLAAKPFTEDWLDLDWQPRDCHFPVWEEWCSSQTWRVNILPSLKSLGIQTPKGCSSPRGLDNSLLFRFVAWTRRHLVPPLQHLKVWEGRGTPDVIMEDYISGSYLQRHLGTSDQTYDSFIVRGMVTQQLHASDYLRYPLFTKLQSTILFRRLQGLRCGGIQIPVLPYLEQIKELVIWSGSIFPYSLNDDYPMVHTVQKLTLHDVPIYWMLGRTFKALRHCILSFLPEVKPGVLSDCERLHVDMPACVTLEWVNSPLSLPPLFYIPNLQSLQWRQWRHDFDLTGAVLKSLHNVLLKFPCLKQLKISIDDCLGLVSLIHLVFYDAWEQGVWQGISSVQVSARFGTPGLRDSFLSQMVKYKGQYTKWWKEFTVDCREAGIVSCSAST